MNALAPWDFSAPVEAGASAVPNLPTAEGRALGAEVARLADIAEAKMLARFPGQRRRCDDCAFRAGSIPNGCPSTLMDAIKAGIEREPFWCHAGATETEEPIFVCAGWLAWALDTEDDASLGLGGAS